MATLLTTYDQSAEEELCFLSGSFKRSSARTAPSDKKPHIVLQKLDYRSVKRSLYIILYLRFFFFYITAIVSYNIDILDDTLMF